MIKSELVKRISSQNPHLYDREIEKVVNAIFDEMVEALRRGDRVELRGFGVFLAKLRGPRLTHALIGANKQRGGDDPSLGVRTAVKCKEILNQAPK